MSVPHTSPDKPLRSDAERNRQRILQAAGYVFAERGLDVSLDDIAAAAEVGVGTVYRRFPDKEALIDALFEDKVREVVDVVRTAAELEDPWESFETFVRSVAGIQADDRGLKEALMAAHRGRDRLAMMRDQIAPLAIGIVGRAQKAGVVRPDLGVLDIPATFLSIGYLADRTREVAPGYWERLLTIFLDGVRADAARTPMPAAPLTQEQWTNAISKRR
jgi:AcrR family transcriptional regulator